MTSRETLQSIIEFARGDKVIGAYDKWQKMQGPKMRRQLQPVLEGEGHLGRKWTAAVLKKDARALGKLTEESPNSGMVTGLMKTLRD